MFVYSGGIRMLIAIATYSLHTSSTYIKGKEENDIFFYLIGNIWIFLQKCVLSSPPRFI